MKIGAVAVMAAVIGSGASAAPASLAGDWDGALAVGAVTLRLALHVHAGPQGLSGTLDSIDQGASGLQIPSIEQHGLSARFTVPQVHGAFSGALSADGDRLDGSWTQGPATLPLEFRRHPVGVPEAKLSRPQEPVPPFPYQDLQVAFPSPGAHATLAGELTEPRGPGPFAAAVLIAGSGPNGRDELVAGHRPFLVLADYLTRRGLAVLRYDKRGIGGSGGDYASATTADFASDAEAAVAFLRSRAEIDGRRIGLLGHSEGGLIAPLVADKDRGVAFVVLLAAPGVDGARILEAQGAAIGRVMGVPADKAAQAQALNARLFAAIEKAGDQAAAVAAAKAILTSAATTAKAPPGSLDQAAAAMANPWFRFFLSYDPVPALSRLRCPVLALWGSKDLQVPPDENAPVVSAALSHDPDVQVEVLPGLNHLFQPATTGSPAEYSAIAETFDPAALQKIGDWIERRARR
ncbi:MAG TPA: alpha/beta fold hydrolase [Caulobacteraceae bacterium]|nr:alpha/beta fold hydrolase [Caulobacteraceae bacterium]